MCTKTQKAKIDNYSDIIFISNKVALQFIFAFVISGGELVLAALMVLWSYWLYSSFTRRHPYYNKKL
jgi:hypothetical protein